MKGVVIDKDGWKFCRFKDGSQQLYSLREDHLERHDAFVAALGDCGTPARRVRIAL